jgi:hypothetical protein
VVQARGLPGSLDQAVDRNLVHLALPESAWVATHPPGQLAAGEELKRELQSSDRLSASGVTLAEAYRAAGFRTAAFVANPWLDRRFGFEQGFEHYDDSFARWGVPGERVMKSALEWLATLAPDERFFLYVHTIDTHCPYPALPEISDGPRRFPPPALSFCARPQIATCSWSKGCEAARPPREATS